MQQPTQTPNLYHPSNTSLSDNTMQLGNHRPGSSSFLSGQKGVVALACFMLLSTTGCQVNFKRSNEPADLRTGIQALGKMALPFVKAGLKEVETDTNSE